MARLSDYINVGKIETYAVPKLLRLISILGSHRVILIAPDGNRIDIGRGSIGALKCIRYYNTKKIETPILQVGEFCEFSDVKIIVGGEHKNEQAINTTFSSLPILSSYIASNNIDSYCATTKGAISIDDFTVISQGALVLSGSKIGKGCVIGAGAVVSGTIPATSVCVGSVKNVYPRKLDMLNQKLIDVLDTKRLSWKLLLEVFDLYAIHDIAGAIDLVKNNSLETEGHEVNALIFDTSKNSEGHLDLRNFVGVIFNGKQINATSLPAEFIDYLKQGLLGEENLNWTIDIFSYISNIAK